MPDSLFGAGDTLDLVFAGGAAGTQTLTFDTDFKGDTVEDQAQSIADKLSGTGAVAADFDVTVDGNKVTITSKYEGTMKDASNAAPSVTSIKATDKATTKDTAKWKETQAGTATAATSAKFVKLFDNQGSTSAGSLNVAAGDKLTFNFTINGKNYKAELEITDNMIANDTATTTSNIKTALENTKFTDSDDTSAADESLLKVGDLFTITANGTNGGDLEFAGKGNGLNVTAATVETSRTTGSVASSTLTGAVTAGTAGKVQQYKIGLDVANGATNFSKGDKLTFTGTLSDGRTFDVTLEAGKDFDIGTNIVGSMTNIKTVLEAGKNGDKAINATVKGGGKEVQVSSDNIFGAKGDFTIGAAANPLQIDSKTAGVTGAPGVATITNVALDAAQGASITDELKPAEAQSQAESTITFSDGMQYGATITVGDKTYELVADKDNLSSQKNIAVVVSDLSDANEVAKTMAKAINDNAEKDDKGTALYTAAAKENVVTITTAAKGSAVAAPTVSAAKDISTELSFTLDPEKTQAGSYVTINGQDYQFVADRADAEAGKTAVVVDFKNATSQSLGQALADVASGKNNANVSMDESGKITVRSINEVDGEMPVPTASFHDGKGGLVLQIGDTADDYNKMKVSIYKMKCADMGIGDISILDQDSAGAAIDKIRDAINYVSDVRGTLGATQNRLDHTINNLSVMQENIQDAESTIRDTDVAAEMMEYTKNNILIQSAQAMLAQANQVPQGVLQLLQ